MLLRMQSDKRCCSQDSVVSIFWRSQILQLILFHSLLELELNPCAMFTNHIKIGRVDCVFILPLYFPFIPNSFLTTCIFKKIHGEPVESSDFGIDCLDSVTYWFYALEQVIESLYFSFLVCKMGMIMMMIITIVIIINCLEGCY